MAQDSEAEGVDKRISLITIVERDVTTHGGNSNAVTVVSDAGHNAAKETPRRRRR